MLSKIFQILLSTILVLSVVSPTVLELVDIEHEISFSEDIEDDQKEGKKELELNDLFFLVDKENPYESILLGIEKSVFIKQCPTLFYLEITSPPPEV